ncbi:hypothetical protein ACFQS3_01655 [Glycomyces mayteni]|uniref:WXG100 family type VII secretion target n=1 Tax=Glycomyces mayteni TaxID=543887 RepID=A0ABW2D4A6_9ACTN
MAADPIREPDFGTVLDRAVADFRKALLKRWRERAAEVVAEGKGRFPQGWRRSGGAEPMWPYWEALARLHVDYRHYRCRVVHWAESGQNGPVPKCEGSMDLGPVSMERPSYIDAKGVQRAIPDRIECGMPQIMAQIEAWSHQEAAVVRAALPEFGVHDLGEIEQAQAALLNLGGQLGLEAAKGSDQTLPFKPASNADLLSDLGKLAENNNDDAGWYAAWTGAAAKALKDGFFDSVEPTFKNQAGIAGSLSNLYAARGTVVYQGRSGDLKILTEATKALGETKTTETDLDVVWKVFGAIGTGVAAFPPATAVGTVVSLAGIAGEIFLPKVKSVSYATTVEEAMKAVWDDIDDHNTEVASAESDFSSGAAAVRDVVYGIHSFNLEFYDITQNNAKGNAGKGAHADVDEIMKIAGTCFEAAKTYEGLVRLLDGLDGAEPSLSDKDGAEAGGDAKLKGLREEFRGFLSTACGRLYETGTQIKEAARLYAKTDEEQAAVFASIEWEEGEAPEKAKAWAEATDRSGWDPYEGSSVMEGQKRPGHNDPGADDYATALGG